MSNETNTRIEIPVYCPQERREVAVIELPPTVKRGDRVAIDGGVIWRGYVPNEERYKLKGPPNDGDLLVCPHCRGNLALRGAVVITKPRTEGGKRERTELPADTVAIVVAGTGVIVE